MGATTDVSESASDCDLRLDAMQKQVNHQGKMITDLQEYTKFQTFAIEQLFSICHSLQHSNERVSHLQSVSSIV